MRNNDNSDLIGYGIAAIIAVVVLYSFWQYIVGALALFGIGYVIQQVNRNNRR
jgi:predicted PurR-regulated permease PerM